jgi:hypothetical protein
MELCNSAFPGVLSIDPHSPLTSPASIHMNFKLQCQKFIEIVKADPDQGPDALMFAQQVLLDFTHLDPEGRDHYESHITEIVSVIAYSNPEDSPNGHHMKQEARDHLADIMNSAVLGTLVLCIQWESVISIVLSIELTKYCSSTCTRL